MPKQMKSSENLGKMTIQETQETNFTKYLENTKDSSEIRGILKFMRNTFIKSKEVEYISIDDYIYFYSQIPLSLWSNKIFYFKNEKWDALGLLGERIHQFNLHSKTLHLYFKDCVGISITNAIDGEEDLYADVDCPKARFIKYLEFINSNSNTQDLKKAFVRAQKIVYDRYY
jgi:hypothetical protein